MKTLSGLKCSVTPNSSLNTSKGIVRCQALSRVKNDDIKEGMAEQGVWMLVESLYVVMALYLHFNCESLNEPLHLRCRSYLHEQIDLSHTHIRAI